MKSKSLFIALALLTVTSVALMGAPLAQARTNAQTGCVETYTVVAGDLLSSLALKYLGDLKAYPQIVQATNNAGKTDTSFKTIADANLIDVGQKLCIPAKGASTATAPAANTTPAATTTTAPAATASAPALTAALLGNATYTVPDAPGGKITLNGGKAEVEVAPGSASKFTAQLGEQIANGTLGSQPYAAAILITSGGGSGTFYNVAAVPNENGKAGTGIVTLLGDRIKVSSVAIENGAIKVSYLDRKPDEPFTAEPTVAMSKVLVVENGKLVEGSTILPVTPTPPAGSLEGTYIASVPAADAAALLWEVFLGPNGNASWLSNYVGKGTINATGTWQQTTPTTVLLTLIHREDKNINEQFTLEVQGDKLVATQYNQSLYGADGITLYRADGVIQGQASYLEKIALPNDAVLEVYLLDASKADVPATYVSGYSASTHGDQVPLSFQLPYSKTQTLPNGNYLVQAFISANGKLLFKNSNGVAVITNGAPTTNVQVVVQPPQ